MKNLESTLTFINTFKMLYPSFEMKVLIQDCKKDNIKNIHALITKLSKYKVFIRYNGQYCWQKEPLHINKLTIILSEIKEDMRKYNINTKEKQRENKAKQAELSSFVQPLIEILEKQGLVVDASNVKADVSLSVINILKSMGYKILKPIQQYEEI